MQRIFYLIGLIDMINSMVLNEAFLITLLIYSCIYVTVTDIRHGLIQNKVIAVTGLLGLLANLIYYTVFAEVFLVAFVLNVAVMAAISIAFYALHIWAAGDSKLLMLAVFLIPARIYYEGNNVTATVIIMILIFSIAYIYIILESIYLGIKEKNFFQWSALKTDIRQMVKQYIKCTCLVTLFGMALRFLVPEFYDANLELVMLLNMILILWSFHFKLFDRSLPLFLLVLATAASYFFLQSITVSINPKIYLVVIMVLLLRLFVEKYNYRKIPTSQVKKGMVLAYSTVISFLPSTVKGLPHSTTEDIRARLSFTEAESIKRWENSKYGQPTIVIVRKMPFAVFISMGAVLYTVMRILIR